MKRLLPDPELEALIRNLNSTAREAGEESTDEAVPDAGTPATGATASRWPLPEPVDDGKACARQPSEFDSLLAT